MCFWNQSVHASRSSDHALRALMRQVSPPVASQPGEWSRAIVTAADEFSPIVNQAYQRHGLYGPGGFVAGAGAVTLLLESESALSNGVDGIAWAARC